MPLMLINAFGFIKKYWQLFVIAGAVFCMYLYWADRTDTINDLRDSVSDLTTELNLKEAQYEENERRFKREIADQNQKIKQANDDFKELEQEAELLVAKEQARSSERVKKLEEQLNILRNLPTPQTCEASMEMLINIGVANKWPTK